MPAIPTAGHTSSPASSTAGKATEPAAPQNDWRVQVLQSLGAPVTKKNLAFLGAWQASEGGHTNNAGKWNYLNVTVDALRDRGLRSDFPYFVSSNGSHIAIFPDERTGTSILAQYLTGGQYPGVVTGLRKGDPTSPVLQSVITGDLSTWLTGKRVSSSGQEYARKILFATGAGGSFDIGHTVSGAVGGVASHIPGAGIVSGAVDAVTAPAHAIEWLWGNWDRVALVLGGGVLVIVGVVLLGVRLGLTPGPGKLARMAAVGAAQNATSGGREASAIARETERPRAAREGVRRRTESVGGEPRRVRRRSGYDPSTSEIPY